MNAQTSYSNYLYVARMDDATGYSIATALSSPRARLSDCALC